MPKISSIKGINSLLRKLKVMKTKAHKDNNVSVVTGYAKNYALWVHEMPVKHRGEPREGSHPGGQDKKGAYWDPSGRGQPKYLEQPSRELRNEFRTIITLAVKNGAPLNQALKLAALLLQRTSQKLVPVDSGDLKGSAFTKVES